MMIEDPDALADAKVLMMSPTWQRLVAFSQDCPLDLRDPDQVKTALATASRVLIGALDAQRLHFDDPEDAAMLHALLMTALEVVMDGRLSASVRTARVN